MNPDLITEIVAIDGPAGAGKSTIARRVAELLGFAFLDTGAMYRAATWRAMHHGVDLDDPEALAASTRAMRLDMCHGDGLLRVIVDGLDVTAEIRTPEVTREVYRLDRLADVRAPLVELQREWGAKRPTVAEGRDMGTVVFPRAKCKVYMDASLDERARRRAAELKAKGTHVDIDALRQEIHERDHKAMTRAVSPLRRADDAVLVDTTAMTIEQVAARVADLARAVL